MCGEEVYKEVDSDCGPSLYFVITPRENSTGCSADYLLEVS